MGAWGTGIFDNDTASDWGWALEESEDLSVIEQAIGAVLATGGEYLDASFAQEALAACETIARLQGAGGVKNAYSEAVDAWVKSHKKKLKIPAELAAQAQEAIERIISSPSELMELWQETDEFGDWKMSIEDLRSRIRA